jgi:CRISPR/Cas system CSM-associated protein Csm2 small subunit
MIGKLYLILPLFLLVNCDIDSNLPSINESENEDEKISLENSQRIQKSIDTNEIISLISLYEHVKREQNREIFSLEKIQELKKSVNYDSITMNQDLPVFKNP